MRERLLINISHLKILRINWWIQTPAARSKAAHMLQTAEPTCAVRSRINSSCPAPGARRMNMTEIIAAEHVADAELRERAMVSPKARRTTHYLVHEDGSEIAFLSLDHIPGVNYLVLYEIFIPKRLRGQGTGTRLLTEVESLARLHGCERIVLRPRPLDLKYPEAKLVNWYNRCGFNERADVPGELEKWIVRGPTAS